MQSAGRFIGLVFVDAIGICRRCTSVFKQSGMVVLRRSSA